MPDTLDLGREGQKVVVEQKRCGGKLSKWSEHTLKVGTEYKLVAATPQPLAKVLKIRRGGEHNDEWDVSERD